MRLSRPIHAVFVLLFHILQFHKFYIINRCIDTKMFCLKGHYVLFWNLLTNLLKDCTVELSLLPWSDTAWNFSGFCTSDLQPSFQRNWNFHYFLTFSGLKRNKTTWFDISSQFKSQHLTLSVTHDCWTIYTGFGATFAASQGPVLHTLLNRFNPLEKWIKKAGWLMLTRPWSASFPFAIS